MKKAILLILFILISTSINCTQRPRRSFIGHWVDVAGEKCDPDFGYSADSKINLEIGTDYVNDVSQLLDSNDNPCIVWSNGPEGRFLEDAGILFVRWDGANWVNAAGIKYNGFNANVSKNGVNSNSPTLAIDSYGNPCIAWVNVTFDASNYEKQESIIYIEWNGSSWVNSAGDIYDGKNAFITFNSIGLSKPIILLDTNDKPNMIWSQGTNEPPNNADIFFVKWDGSNWVNVAGETLDKINANVSNTYHDSINASFDLDSSNYPCIAWEDIVIEGEDGTSTIMFTRWDGSRWINSKKQEYDGTNGIEDFGLNFPIRSDPSLAIDSSDNPCIAWLEQESVLFAIFDRDKWLSAEGKTGDYLSYNANRWGGSSCPSLKLNNFDNPCISWNDVNSNVTYYIEWDGKRWSHIDGSGRSSLTCICSSDSHTFILDSSSNPCFLQFIQSYDPVPKASMFFVRWVNK